MRALQDLATGGLLPDLTILLDVRVDVGLQRRQSGRPDDLNKFELDGTFDRAYHERVRAGYLREAAAGGRWRVVDASGAPDAVAEEIAAIVLEALRRGH